MVSAYPPSLWGEHYARARQARPFLKWAGGKRRFLYLFGKHVPHFSGKYVEPFLGGGSVFFFLARAQERPFIARLGDTNLHLVRCFIEVRDDPEGVHNRLEVLQAGYGAANDKAAYYYETREHFNRRHPKSDAAQFIFLNQTCWNGLWRINARGHFNVPYGAPKVDVVIPTLDELLNAAAALQTAHVRATSWENTLAFAEPGDFVFLDPPYYSDALLRDNTTTKYQRSIFGLREHKRLAEAARRLADRHIDFILTNSAEDEMVDLYREFGLSVTPIQIPRNINSKATERQPVPELIVTSHEDGRRAEDTRGAVLLDLEFLGRQRTSDGETIQPPDER